MAELQAGFDDAARDDVHARVGDDRHHHRDLVHAGLAQHELGQAAGLRDRRVAADLAVVGRACPPWARTASNSVSEPPPAPITRPRLPSNSVTLPATPRWSVASTCLAGELERRRLARLAGLLLADAEVREQLPVAPAGLVLDVHVRVERDERAVGEPPERVDLGEDHVVLDEQPRQARDDRDELVQRRAGDAGGGDHLLGLEVAEAAGCWRSAGARPSRAAPRRPARCRCRRPARRSSPAACGCRPRRRRRSTPARPRPWGRRARRAACARPISSARMSRACASASSGVSANLTPPAFIRPPVSTCDLITVGPADALRDLARLGGVGGEAVVGDGDAGALDDLAGLVLEEPHAARKPIGSRSGWRPRRSRNRCVQRSATEQRERGVLRGRRLPRGRRR